MTIQIYLDKDSYTETEERELAPEWDRLSTSTTWDFNSVHLSAGLGWREAFPVDFPIAVGDTIWLVVAVWSTGDSFGQDSGAHSEIFGAFDNPGQAYSFEEQLKSGHVRTNTGKPLYLPWSGYFESLDYTSVLERTVS